MATAKALSINAAFERSLEFWASLAEKGQLDPASFLHQVPHLSLVWGQDDVAFLQQRHRQLSQLPAFSAMQWSVDAAEIADWMPLVMEGRRRDQPLAATRIERGVDLDFGSLTRVLLQPLQTAGALEVCFGTSVAGADSAAHSSDDLRRLAVGAQGSLRSPLRSSPLCVSWCRRWGLAATAEQWHSGGRRLCRVSR